MRYLGIENNRDAFDFKFEGKDTSKVKPVLDTFFEKCGYKNLGFTYNKNTYEKGNRTTRLLLGAFVTYHKMDVLFLEEENLTLRLLKASSGMSGGIIGMNQAKSEYTIISNQLNDYFENESFI